MAFMLNFNKTCRHGTTMTTKRGSLQTLTHLLSLKIMLRMWNIVLPAGFCLPSGYPPVPSFRREDFAVFCIRCCTVGRNV